MEAAAFIWWNEDFRQIPAIFGVSSIIGSFDKKMPKRWHVPHIWNPNYFSHDEDVAELHFENQEIALVKW